MSAVTAKCTAIVTGGSLGIGKEIARQLLDQGTDVMVVGRKQANIDDAVEFLQSGSGSGAGEVSGFAADVASEAEIDSIITEALSRWGRIDVLVNNAGIFDDETFLTLSKDSWDAVIAVNLTAPFLLTQRVGKVMAEQGGGSIVNLASIDGHRVDGTYPAYNVSKAGILHLTRQAAVELGPLGIRCNSVSPGWTRTPMVESALTTAQLHYMTSGFERHRCDER